MYQVLLFDADNTLFDFDACERQAMNTRSSVSRHRAHRGDEALLPCDQPGSLGSL